MSGARKKNSNLKTHAEPSSSSPEKSLELFDADSNLNDSSISDLIPDISQIFNSLSLQLAQPRSHTVEQVTIISGNNNAVNNINESKKNKALQKTVDKSELEHYLESSKKLEKRDLNKIAKSLGNEWRCVEEETYCRSLMSAIGTMC